MEKIAKTNNRIKICTLEILFIFSIFQLYDFILLLPLKKMPKSSEHINDNEYLPGRYTDLTSLNHKRPLHSASNHESLDFFRGFHLSELGMDILNTLQVKSSKKV